MSKTGQRIVSAISWGKYHCRKGLTLKDCPYPKGHPQRNNWKIGFMVEKYPKREI